MNEAMTIRNADEAVVRDAEIKQAVRHSEFRR